MIDFSPLNDPASPEFCTVIQAARSYAGLVNGQPVTVTVDGKPQRGRLVAFSCVGRAPAGFVAIDDPAAPWVYVRRLDEVKP